MAQTGAIPERGRAGAMQAARCRVGSDVLDATIRSRFMAVRSATSGQAAKFSAEDQITKRRATTARSEEGFTIKPNRGYDAVQTGPGGTKGAFPDGQARRPAAWDPKFGSLLELAEACDVSVRWSCRSGVCHTCMTGLIGGSIIYNPEPLERPATGNVLVCCSQPDTGVTLDL